MAISELPDEYRYTPQALAFHEDFAKQLFPVSIDWEPPFTMLVPIKEQGDRLVRDCHVHCTQYAALSCTRCQNSGNDWSDI